MQRIEAMSSTAPAAPNRCPVIDLVEEMANFLAWSPKTILIALVSVLSFNGVDVPCAFTY